MNDTPPPAGPQKRIRDVPPPSTEPFLYRWTDAELVSLHKGANAQLLRVREVWRRTTSDDERARLNRKIRGLADLVLKIEQLQRERTKRAAEGPEPPDSRA